MMDAGRRNRRITLMRATTTYDEWNQPSSSWMELGKRWAEKTDLSDAEKLRAAQLGSALTSRFVLPFDSLTRTLTTEDRITLANTSYDIIGIKELGTRENIEITAAAPGPVLGVDVAP